METHYIGTKALWNLEIVPLYIFQWQVTRSRIHEFIMKLKLLWNIIFVLEAIVLIWKILYKKAFEIWTQCWNEKRKVDIPKWSVAHDPYEKLSIRGKICNERWWPENHSFSAIPGKEAENRYLNRPFSPTDNRAVLMQIETQQIKRPEGYATTFNNVIRFWSFIQSRREKNGCKVLGAKVEKCSVHFHKGNIVLISPLWEEEIRRLHFYFVHKLMLFMDLGYY